MIDFQKRAQDFQAQASRLKPRSRNLALIRAGIFIFILLIWFYPDLGGEKYLIALLAVALFLLTINKHQQVNRKIKLLETLGDINEGEYRRSQLDFRGLPTGSSYQDPKHPYQTDLDIFGNHSLFQLLNRCVLQGSEERLAEALSTKATPEEIKLRQEALQELKPKLDWNQQFSAEAQISLEKEQDPTSGLQELKTFIEHPFTPRYMLLRTVLACLAIVCTVLIAVGVVWFDLAYQWFYTLLITNLPVLGITAQYLHQQMKGMMLSYNLVHTYSGMIQLIENTDFQSTKLVQIQQNLQGKNSQRASLAVRDLARIIHFLDSRSNMLYVVLNFTFLLDVFLLRRWYHWKQKHQNELFHWLDQVHEMELLLSLTGLQHTHPHFIFPELTDKPYTFHATALGHPLIAESEKVRNDYTIQQAGAIDIITGSNMSGKSTFERTVGVNMVLAQLGAPVDATVMKMSSFQVFTSMRSQDDLASHTSSFYAELKRLRQLIDLTETGQPIFILLDEILKGTNSMDRQKGAQALALKLSHLSCSGMISTHDLQLGELAADNPHFRNFSFNSVIEGDKILFDYILTPGICKSFNASQLMKNMGLM